jgi:hypothetical protein
MGEHKGMFHLLAVARGMANRIIVREFSKNGILQFPLRQCCAQVSSLAQLVERGIFTPREGIVEVDLLHGPGHDLQQFRVRVCGTDHIGRGYKRSICRDWNRFDGAKAAR